MDNQSASETGRRPLQVIVVAFLFILAGVFGFIHHVQELFEETDSLSM